MYKDCEPSQVVCQRLKLLFLFFVGDQVLHEIHANDKYGTMTGSIHTFSQGVTIPLSFS